MLVTINKKYFHVFLPDDQILVQVEVSLLSILLHQHVFINTIVIFIIIIIVTTTFIVAISTFSFN